MQRSSNSGATTLPLKAFADEVLLEASTLQTCQRKKLAAHLSGNPAALQVVMLVAVG